MQKDIRIGEQMVPMRATAATAYRYRQTFHGDLLTELAKKKEETENVELVQRLAFIMAKSATDTNMNTLNEDAYFDWLEQFETIDLVEALPQVIALYMTSKGSTSEAKKNKTR